jgi:hypothetical protein
MPNNCSTAVDHPAPDDLIGFLKALTDDRSRRGVGYLKWLLLLVAVLGIMSGSAAPVMWNLSPNGIIGCYTCS